MCSEDEGHVVCVEELLNSIRSKLNNVTCTVWISDEVGLNAQLLIIVSWVRPQDVNYQLLLRCRHLMDDFQWSLNSFNLLKAGKCGTNTTMQAYNLVLNDSSEWQPIEQLIDFVEH